MGSITKARTPSSRGSKRRTLLKAALLTVMASSMVHMANASLAGDSVKLQNGQEEGALMAKRAVRTTAQQTAWVQAAVALAGTLYPTVSPLAGDTKTTLSNASKTSSTTTTTKASTTTVVTTTTKTTTTTATSTTTSRAAVATTKTTTTLTSSATTATTTKAPAKTQTWSWAAAGYGCATGTASGSMIMCQATGLSARAMPTAAAALASRAEALTEPGMLYVERADTAEPVVRPDVGWLDTVVGAVPYKAGDFIPSIAWVVATFLLTPLFILRLVRRSSLIPNVLSTVFLWCTATVASFGIRAYMAANVPSTRLMLAENGILQILPNLVLEPLLCLLSLYAAQNESSRSPKIFWLLRGINLAALALYTVSSVFFGYYLNGWDKALQSATTSGADLPSFNPTSLIQLGPIIASFLMIVTIAAGILLIPMARGANGSMRPGAFLALLFSLVGVSVFYRIFQTLHARSVLGGQVDGSNDPFALISDTIPTASAVARALQELSGLAAREASAIAPFGMYETGVAGISWARLQLAQTGRGSPQTPLILNLVFMLPMWLDVFLLFFVHAPASPVSLDAGDAIDEKLESAAPDA